MRTNRTVAERAFAAFLSLVLVLGMFPMRTSAEETAAAYGSVVAATQGVTVSGNGTAEIAATNGDMTLAWHAADPSVGRTQDGNWVGLNLYAPAGMTAEQLQSVQYGYSASALDKSFWANKDSADDAESHYIGLWARTTDAYLEGNKVTYNWYISWDGSNVQHIQLKLDPTKVTLQNADGSEYKITYGTVAPVTPGNAAVTGNGTAAVTVAVDNAELAWSEPNPAIGRNEGGWWVGINAIGPAGFSAAAAKYAYVNADGTYGEAKSFDQYKDGADYIGLWIPVKTEALVNDADRKLTSVYAFDWNGNGTYEQTITFYVNADGNIVLKNAAGQQVYPYLYGSVEAPGALISGNATKTVTVDMNGQEIVWDNGWKTSVKASLAGYEDVTVTAEFAAAGDTTVNQTKEIDWNGDGLVDQTVVLTGSVKLAKAEQIAPVFSEAAVTLDSNILMNSTTNAVKNADKAEGSVSYAIADNDYLQIDSKTGAVSVKPGKWVDMLGALMEGKTVAVEVTAAFAETATHNSSSATYTLTLNPKNDDSLTFAEKNVTMVFGTQDGTVNTYKQVPTSKNGTIDTITYTSGDPAVAVVDENGTVTPVKAGEVTITATVTYEAGYTETVASYELTIEKGEQAPLTFGNATTEITYNDNGNVYTNTAAGGTTAEEIVYEIVSGKDVADINGDTLTIKSAGKVTVKATRPGDHGYNEVSNQYTLTVNKAQQNVSLKIDADSILNSQETYTVEMVPVEGWVSNVPNYDFVIESKDATVTGTSVDAKTGVITVDEGDYGNITVKVTRAGDNCFLDWEGQTFTLTIEQIAADENNFVFSGEKHEGAEDPEWFCGEVTVTYKDGDVAYQVSTDLEKTENWAESFKIGEDGIHNPVLSLKSTENHGGVHYAQNVPTVKIDQTAPESTITYADTVWGKVFENLTFGFYQAETTVIITANDGEGDVSGVSAVFYKLAGDAEFTETKGNTVVVTIPDQYIGQVEFYAVDKAGNVEGQQISGITIVVDSTAATWEVAYAYDKNVEEGEEVYTDENGVQYTRFNTTVTLTVEETFFDLSLDELQVKENEEASAAAPVISGEDAATDWVKGEDGIWSIDLSLTSEGVHDMSMEYTNRSDLASEKYSQKIVIDRTVPVAEIAWADAERVEEDGTRYYKENAEKPATATITVVDANFNPANTVVTDSFEAVNGAKEDKVITAEWKQDEKDLTLWTAEITLKDEGTHNLTVDTTDWAGNVMETKTTDKVVIDYTAPVLEELVFSGPEVMNSKDGRDYYNKPVTVTVTITERNFDEQDVQIALKAVDVTGADNGAKYTLGEWKTEGDKHTVVLTFAADSNYTLDVSYADKANNEGNDVAEKLFTVDQLAPKVTGISYDKSLKDVLIEKITFSYYSAPVEVILTVEDETAGVQRFAQCRCQRGQCRC